MPTIYEVKCAAAEVEKRVRARVTDAGLRAGCDGAAPVWKICADTAQEILSIAELSARVAPRAEFERKVEQFKARAEELYDAAAEGDVPVASALASLEMAAEQGPRLWAMERRLEVWRTADRSLDECLGGANDE